MEDGVDREVKGAESGRGVRRRAFSVVVVVVVAVSLTSWALYEFYLEEHLMNEFDPYVRYSYILSIASNSSEEYTVLCPFLTDSEGIVCSDAIGYLHLSEGSHASIVASERGPVLEVQGSWVTIASLYVYSTFPGPWDRFKEFHYLSLTDTALGSGNTSFHSDSGDILLGLVFDYDYVYGNLGADFIRYEAEGILPGDGWTDLPVEHWHAVS